MRLHLVGIFHTKHQASYSHCAFTGKALRFPKMMQKYGYHIIEYSNEGSESSADEKVVMMRDAEFNKLYGSRKDSDFYGDNATIGSEGHKLFEDRLVSEMRQRIQPGDIVCHPFGHAHQILMNVFNQNRHVETGIGYPTLMPDSFRIFESYAWMHYHQGKEGRNGKNYEWVVPNYYDLDDWEPNTNKPGEYLAFLGRITQLKGIDTIKAIADYSPWPIVLHGQGDQTPWSHPNIEYRGPISGRDRSDFLRNARALLAPTVFTEPFCGMSVEAMLCGTPIISVNYGAMTETVTEGVMGYRCHTLQDWLDAIDAVGDLDRSVIADIARSRWSLEACGKRYDKIFKQLDDLNRKGWYEVDKINFYEIDTEEGPFASRLADWIVDNINPKNVLDVGCGPGTYVKPLLDKGIDAVGIDVDPRVAGRPGVVIEDLFNTTRKAELVVCLEVAEHIEQSRADEIVESVYNCIEASGKLIWTAAHPGQGGVNHINCQPMEYWRDKFVERGLLLDEETRDNLLAYAKSGYHMGWFISNLIVFTKQA